MIWSVSRKLSSDHWIWTKTNENFYLMTKDSVVFCVCIDEVLCFYMHPFSLTYLFFNKSHTHHSVWASSINLSKLWYDRCMEATPSLACANKCVFCWRHHTNPVGKSWQWKMDDPLEIVNSAIDLHTNMIKQMKGVPGNLFVFVLVG